MRKRAKTNDKIISIVLICSSVLMTFSGCGKAPAKKAETKNILPKEMDVIKLWY